jgi:hypothetical protein
MRDFSGDPAFENLKILAEKIEAVVSAANRGLLKGAKLTPEQALDSVATVQAKMLRLDDHGMRRYREALEDKRVRSLSQGNLVMTCVLASAVALSEFKHQPRRISGSWLDKPLAVLKERSTTGLGLGAFSLATLYAVLGRGIAGHLEERRKDKTLKA